MPKPHHNPFGTPGKNSPAIFAFDMPKASLGSSTKAMHPGSPKPSWRSGNTHGFCVTGGHPPIASEPTPSLRLWATTPGATPARLTEHTTSGPTGHSKPELSTLLGIGTFYFALTRLESRPQSVYRMDRCTDFTAAHSFWLRSRRPLPSRFVSASTPPPAMSSAT
jgi:hypothetical protein